MSRYIDADALTSKVRHVIFELIDKVEPIMTEDGGAFDLKIVNPLLEANKAIASIIREQPTADVVSKKKYDELNERYHRLLESAKILADTVRDYERREDEQIH